MNGTKLNRLLYTSHRLPSRISTGEEGARRHFSTYEETETKNLLDLAGGAGRILGPVLNFFRGTTNGMHAFERYHIVFILLPL